MGDEPQSGCPEPQRTEGSERIDTQRLLFRDAQPQDVAHVNRLAGDFYGTPPATTWSDAITHDALTHGLVACVGDQPIAYAVIRIRGAEAELRHMIVAPQYRRQGVASLLVVQAQAWARHRKCRRMRLWVMTANEPALRAYRKAGFAVRRYVMESELQEPRGHGDS